MGYILDKDSMDLVKLAKDFAENKVKPLVAELDRAEKCDPNDPNDEAGQKLKALYEEAVNIGFCSLEIPEEYGGMGQDYYTVAAVYEELSKVDAGFATAVAASGLGLKPVLQHGTDAQKQLYADYLSGEKQSGEGMSGFCAFCLTEPNAGSDAAAGTTVAVKKGDEYILNGTKCFITNGGVASVYTVFAITVKSKGVKGISAFIVERDREGVSIGAEEDKMGIRLSNTTEVIFQDVHIPADHLLGEEGKGFVYAMQTLDLARPMIGALAVGIAQRGIDEAVKYAHERVTFGKPIIKHEAIAFKLADMDIMTEVGRSSIKNFLDTYYSEKNGFGKRNYTREAAICKCFCGDMCVQVALDAIQILGGFGYSREYPVEKLVRDAKIMQIYEGTNEVQRIVISGFLAAKK